jgi:hypothetical protein
MAAESVGNSSSLRCDICGGGIFAPGPGDRLSSFGTPPKCVQCGSLERHRVLHRLLETLPDTLTKGATACQISLDVAIARKRFKKFDSASLKTLAEVVAVPQFDWVFALHVLDMVADEKEFIQELLWRTRERGIIVLAVSGPPFRSSTSALAQPADGCYRVYGSDFADHIAALGLDLPMMEIVGADSVTAALVPVFLLCRQEAFLAEQLEPLSHSGFYARICHHGAGAAAAVLGTSPSAAEAPAGPPEEKRPQAAAIAASQEHLRPLHAAIEEWKNAWGTAPFFLRDDDAARVTPRLQRLLGICRETKVQVMLSVIPGRLQPDLIEAMMDCEHAVPVQHGYQHESHSTVEGVKSEFPDEEALELQLDRTKKGFDGMAAAFGDRFMPILVPPWNNISQQLAANLADTGIAGLSCSGRRGSAVAYKIKVFNSWVSLNNFAMLEAPFDPSIIVDKYVRAIRNRMGRTQDRLEPIGLTTHHLVTSEAQFRFLQGLIETVQDAGGQWLSPQELMSVEQV